METVSVLLALCEVFTPVTGGFTSQRPVTRSFEVFFDLRLNKQSRRHQARYDVTVMLRLSKLNQWKWILYALQ